jgi:hypothetical protein
LEQFFLYYDFLPKGLGKLWLAKGIKGKKIRKNDGINKNNNHPSIISQQGASSIINV